MSTIVQPANPTVNKAATEKPTVNKEEPEDSYSESESESDDETCTLDEKPESEKKDCDSEDSTIKARIDWFGPYNPEDDKCDTDLTLEYKKRLFKKTTDKSLLDRLIEILLIIPFPPQVKLAVRTLTKTALPIAQNAVKQVIENKELIKKVGCLMDQDNMTTILKNVANEQVNKTIELVKEKVETGEELLEEYTPPNTKQPCNAGAEDDPTGSPDDNADDNADAKADGSPADKADDKADAKADAKADSKADAKADAKAEVKGGKRMFFTEEECSFF